MHCENCNLDLTKSKLDFVRCSICPVVVCEHCDYNTNFMKLDEDCIIRCSLCVEERQVLSPRSPPCGYLYPPNQDQESNIENVTLSESNTQVVPNLHQKPRLLIEEK